jgi:hypothetical protein
VADVSHLNKPKMNSIISKRYATIFLTTCGHLCIGGCADWLAVVGWLGFASSSTSADGGG